MTPVATAEDATLENLLHTHFLQEGRGSQLLNWELQVLSGVNPAEDFASQRIKDVVREHLIGINETPSEECYDQIYRDLLQKVCGIQWVLGRIARVKRYVDLETSTKKVIAVSTVLGQLLEGSESLGKAFAQQFFRRVQLIDQFEVLKQPLLTLLGSEEVRRRIRLFANDRMENIIQEVVTRRRSRFEQLHSWDSTKAFEGLEIKASWFDSKGTFLNTVTSEVFTVTRIKSGTTRGAKHQASEILKSLGQQPGHLVENYFALDKQPFCDVERRSNSSKSAIVASRLASFLREHPAFHFVVGSTNGAFEPAERCLPKPEGYASVTDEHFEGPVEVNAAKQTLVIKRGCCVSLGRPLLRYRVIWELVPPNDNYIRWRGNITLCGFEPTTLGIASKPELHDLFQFFKEQGKSSHPHR